MTSLEQLVLTMKFYIIQLLRLVLHRSSIPSYITSILFINIFNRLRAWCLCGRSFGLAFVWFIIIMSSVLRVYQWLGFRSSLTRTTVWSGQCGVRLWGRVITYQIGPDIVTHEHLRWRVARGLERSRSVCHHCSEGITLPEQPFRHPHRPLSTPISLLMKRVR